MPSPRILIVDDDSHLVEALTLWFGKYEYEILTAENGDQAVRMLRTGSPVDLVLSDFMMPEINGLELVRLIKSNTELCSIRIVVMSNNADPEFRKRAADLGALDFLLKTSGARYITERVAAILGAAGAGPIRDTPGDAQLMSQALVALLAAANASADLPESTRATLNSASILAGQLHQRLARAPIGTARATGDAVTA